MIFYFEITKKYSITYKRNSKKINLTLFKNLIILNVFFYKGKSSLQITYCNAYRLHPTWSCHLT
jgi:hypothetical protein